MMTSISPSLNSFCLCIIFSLKTSLNRLFDNVQQTNTQDQKKFRIFGDVENKVNNRTYDFSLTTNCKSKWSQSSIIRNVVRKWNKLPRVLTKGKIKNFFKKIKRRDAKKTRTSSNGQKMKALKVLFL